MHVRMTIPLEDREADLAPEVVHAAAEVVAGRVEVRHIILGWRIPLLRDERAGTVC